MATTTNFGWTTPNNTDLVKDGAAAIRTLGNGIDASFVDLKGGTTGQALTKQSNTDLDFQWTTLTADITEVNAGTGLSGGGTSGAVTLTNTMATAIDAKGDLIVGTGADTFSRLAVGTTAGHVLKVNSSTATGLEWGSASTPKNFTAVSGSPFTLSATTTYTISGLSNLDEVMILVYNISSVNGSCVFSLQLNGDTGTNYLYAGGELNAETTYSAANVFGAQFSTGATNVPFYRINNAAQVGQAMIRISGGNSSGAKVMTVQSGGAAGGFDLHRRYNLGAAYIGTGTISSISIVSSSGNFDSGTVYVYGAS